MKRRRIPYSARELAFVEARRDLPRVELHAAFVKTFGRRDVTVDHLKSLCTRNGWTTRERWSEHEDALLRALYPDTPTRMVATRIGRSLSTTYQHALKLGLRKSDAYLASPASGRTTGRQGMGTRFGKGHVPANKGLRRPGWAPGRMKQTQFSKGQPGWNWKPIGSTRIVDGYEYTKVADERNVVHTVNWKPTHRLRWEAERGPLAKGMALKCLSNDTLNTDPSNWDAVPRALLPRLNGINGRGFDTAPAELKPVILAVAKLEHAANVAGGLTPVQRMIQKRRRSA